MNSWQRLFTLIGGGTLRREREWSANRICCLCSWCWFILLGLISISRPLLCMFRPLLSMCRPHLSIPRQLASTFRLALLSILWLFNSGKPSKSALTTATFFHFPQLTHWPRFYHQSISYYLLHFCLHLPRSYYLLVTASDNCIYFIMRPTLKLL